MDLITDVNICFYQNTKPKEQLFLTAFLHASLQGFFPTETENGKYFVVRHVLCKFCGLCSLQLQLLTSNKRLLCAIVNFRT